MRLDAVSVDNADRTGDGPAAIRCPASRRLQPARGIPVATREDRPIGTTTAGLPLRPGEHYERCPACSTVYRSKRRTRFRCPSCHRLAYLLAAPDGADYVRRSIEGDARTFRVILRRPAEGETADPGEDTAALFLESAEPPPAPDAPPSAAPTPHPDPLPSPTARAAAADRDRGTGRLGRLWRGSLADLRHRG